MVLIKSCTLDVKGSSVYGSSSGTEEDVELSFSLVGEEKMLGRITGDEDSDSDSGCWSDLPRRR